MLNFSSDILLILLPEIHFYFLNCIYFCDNYVQFHLDYKIDK